MANKPLLSIALLCSNRIDTVRRCLDSLLPIMEQLPSELILLDTSTDPSVPPILAEYTDNITKFEWINDFSAARNETVKRAKGEWYLYIDDDEWFVEIDDLIHFFKSGEYKKYGCANYIQRNFHDPDLMHYSDNWVSRMIRLTPETHFESKIHEYLVPIPGECKNLNLVANHTGYIFQTKEDNKKRFDRNAVLLKEMIEEQPEMLRWRVQLAQEYHAMGMWQELLKFCLDNLEYTKNRNDKWDNRDIGTFYGGAIESYIHLNEYQKGLELGQKALQDKRCSELCQAYIYLRFAVIGFLTENWSLARKSIESYTMIRKELEKTPDKLANQEGALLINEAFDAVPTRRAYSILIAAGLRENTTEELKKYLPKLDWDQKVIYVYEPLIPVLIEAMAMMEYEPVFAETMQLMWNNKELQVKTLKAIVETAQKSGVAEQKLLYILSQITGEHWYIWYAKVLMADKELRAVRDVSELSREPHEESNVETAQTCVEDVQKCAEDMQEDVLNRLLEALLGLFSHMQNVFQMLPDVKSIIDKNGISLEGMYLSVPFEKWQKDLAEFIEKSSEQELYALETELAGIQTKEDVRLGYFYARVAEAKVLYGAGERDFSVRKDLLDSFAQKTLDFLRRYYQPQIFTEAPEILPEYGQAALLIEQGFAMEQENPTEMLRILKEVVDIYPTFASVIRSFISAYGTEQQNAKKRQREEMRQLKAQILAEVHKCVAQKQYAQALAIVEQLKQMLPEDLDVVALALELRLAVINNASI